MVLTRACTEGLQEVLYLEHQNYECQVKGTKSTLSNSYQNFKKMRGSQCRLMGVLGCTAMSFSPAPPNPCGARY